MADRVRIPARVARSGGERGASPRTRHAVVARRHLAALGLQRAVGNRAVQRLVRMASAPRVQRGGDGDETDEDRSGAQTDVQRKMLAIATFRRKLLASSPASDVASSPSAAEGTTWLGKMAVNGLCGGWVEVFRDDPDAITRVYQAVQTWAPRPEVTGLEGDDRAWLVAGREAVLEADDVVAAVLEDLTVHLAKFGVDVDRVIATLGRAYERHKALEDPELVRRGEPPYDDLPDWIRSSDGRSGQDGDAGAGAGAGTAPEDETETLGVKGGADAARMLVERLRQLVGGPGDWRVRIESDLHYMGLRVLHEGGRTTFTVVETEELGMVNVDGWDAVHRALHDYLRGEEELKEVQVSWRTEPSTGRRRTDEAGVSSAAAGF